MIKVEVSKKVVDGKEYTSVYLVMKDRQEDRRFLVVPFPNMSLNAKMYFYSLASKRVVKE